MKNWKQAKLLVLLALVLCMIAACTGPTGDTSAPTESVSPEPTQAQPTQPSETLSVAQRLEEVQKLGEKDLCRYLYQEKLITGEIDANAPKLTLQNVRDIIAKYSYEDKEERLAVWESVLEEIKGIQKYPDYLGGSGSTLYKYFLNENTDPLLRYMDAKEYILITIEYADIEYFNLETGVIERLLPYCQ